MNIQTHTTCDNPACRKPLERRDAHLRSVSFEQLAFCSIACVEIFDQLDKATRRPIPGQRRPVDSRGR